MKLNKNMNRKEAGDVTSPECSLQRTVRRRRESEVMIEGYYWHVSLEGVEQVVEVFRGDKNMLWVARCGRLKCRSLAEALGWLVGPLPSWRSFARLQEIAPVKRARCAGGKTPRQSADDLRSAPRRQSSRREQPCRANPGYLVKTKGVKTKNPYYEKSEATPNDSSSATTRRWCGGCVSCRRASYEAFAAALG